MAMEQPKKVTGGAFGRYMAEHRAALLKELAGKPATASIKLGSERYKALGDAEKRRYEDQYLEAKQQYEKDLAAFKAAGGEMKVMQTKKQKEMNKKGKKTKDPNRPKKPAGGAFGCYLTQHRPAFIKECAGLPITAVAKLASERWRSLSAAQKKPFEEEYKVKKADYEKAMKDYVPPAAEAADDDADGDDDEEEQEEEDGGDEGGENDVEVVEPPAKKSKKGAVVTTKKALLGA